MVAAQSLSQAERAIVSALNTHITRNKEVSLTDLAAECHVAKSTVVKTLQKLGFRGYQEFSYNFRISQDMQLDALLPRKCVQGDADEVVSELAAAFAWCLDKKNLVFLGGRRMGALLASYFSRKLALFDIFAPASYDYAMVDESHLDAGAAFFFFHRNPSRGFGLSGTGEMMIDAVHERGFRTIMFTDSDEPRFAQASDLLIRITDNADPGVDLFATKTIMVFEEALSLFAESREGRGDDR